MYLGTRYSGVRVGFCGVASAGAYEYVLSEPTSCTAILAHTKGLLVQISLTPGADTRPPLTYNRMPMVSKYTTTSR